MKPLLLWNESLARDPYNYQTHLNLGQNFRCSEKVPLTHEKTWSSCKDFSRMLTRKLYALAYEVDTAMRWGIPKPPRRPCALESVYSLNDPDLLRLYRSL